MDAAELDMDLANANVVLSVLSPFSSVRAAFKARASGVLLVAGVGSYCAYRICTKFLGQRFVWMLLESAKFDALASADRRLLYASGLPLSDDEGDDGEQEQSDSGDTGSRDALSDYQRRRFSPQTNSEISLQRLSRYSRKSRGLFAIRQSKIGPEGVLRRQSTSERSNRSHPAACSSPSSDKSASLRIVWEGQQNWDDEFATTEIRPRPSIISRSPLSQQKIVPSNSAGDLGSVFDDVLSLSSAVDQPDGELYDNASESDDAIHIDSVRRKCMIDSKYMYQSVIVASSELGSETSGSVLSVNSNLKELSKRLTSVMDSKGLWELAQETPSTSHSKPERCEMTDSGLTRSTHSKHSQEPRSMFDSAIGGEMFSSEDESNEKPDRHVLNSLRESDSTSQMSLEWCDEGLRRRASISGDDAHFKAGCLDWDYESNRGSAEPFAVSTLHRPKDSRDLMLFACEKFQPYSLHFKNIQHLYHRRRLRRIGPSPRTATETLEFFISSALYHGYDILRKSSQLLENKSDISPDSVCARRKLIGGLIPICLTVMQIMNVKGKLS
ncbi:hypothetical protein KIN20_000470 [Parelaphostrongylus tenuis]|uniref:Uncharacterized protein n=1 Tax=Parelaphostrongylus tenuis TaxID=148309 RepID=A0AAD5MBC4_PARTN|nr:hypothetical protein KIN20_000470 [Parelaphostrongylus tenuis]